MLHKHFYRLNLLIIIFFLISKSAIAHQPKLIYDSPSKNNPFIIKDPEISKAFYGQLKGAPHFFIIKSSKKFLFYTGILSPKTSDKHKWFFIRYNR